MTIAKAATPSDRLAGSTHLSGTSPRAEGPPPADGAQGSSSMAGAEATGATTVMAKPRFYSMAEVAEMFGRKPRTIRHWIARGLLKRKKVGKAVFISERDIDALADAPAISEGK